MPASQLRPRSAPEMLDAAFQLLREHTRSLFVLSAILVIPGVALGVLNSVLFGDMFRPTAVTATQPLAAVGRIFALLLPAMAVWVCWFMVAFGALVWAASAAYMEGRDGDPAEALRAARARAGTLIGGGLLTWLLLLVQFVAVAVVLMVALALLFAGVNLAFRGLQSPAASAVAALLLGLVAFVLVGAAGLMLVGRYIALPGVIIHEQVGVRDAIRRARDLARGSLGRIAALLLLVGVLFLVVSLGFLAVLAIATRSQILAQIIASVVNVPLYALAGTIATVLYYDLRVRAEGLDIELLAEELDALPAGGTADARLRETTP